MDLFLEIPITTTFTSYLLTVSAIPNVTSKRSYWVRKVGGAIPFIVRVLVELAQKF